MPPPRDDIFPAGPPPNLPSPFPLVGAPAGVAGLGIGSLCWGLAGCRLTPCTLRRSPTRTQALRPYLCSQILPHLAPHPRRESATPPSSAHKLQTRIAPLPLPLRRSPRRARFRPLPPPPPPPPSAVRFLPSIACAPPFLPPATRTRSSRCPTGPTQPPTRRRRLVAPWRRSLNRSSSAGPIAPCW